jgi:hypothetical protein
VAFSDDRDVIAIDIRRRIWVPIGYIGFMCGFSGCLGMEIQSWLDGRPFALRDFLVGIAVLCNFAILLAADLYYRRLPRPASMPGQGFTTLPDRAE